MVCDLDHLDATIRMFDPNADTSRVKRYPVKHHARRGHVTRFVLDALRKASGPVTSLDVTQAWVEARGLRADDETVTLIRKRIGACFTGLKAKGIVRQVGLVGNFKGWELVPKP